MNLVPGTDDPTPKTLQVTDRAYNKYTEINGSALIQVVRHKFGITLQPFSINI